MTSVAEIVSEEPKEIKCNTAGETREQINLSSYKMVTAGCKAKRGFSTVWNGNEVQKALQNISQ